MNIFPYYLILGKQKDLNYLKTLYQLDFFPFFSIVADNRRNLMIAEKNCTEDQIKDVRRNVKAFENSLGFLDCRDPYGFIVGMECKISDAMRCFMAIDMEPNSTLSCQSVKFYVNLLINPQFFFFL